MQLNKLTLNNLPAELPSWVASVHGTAVEKGWWEGPPRNVAEVFLLIKSEIIEAFEEYRNGKPLQEIYRKDGSEKPEGFPIEIADAVIRIMDYLGSLKLDSLYTASATWLTLVPVSHVGQALDDVICLLDQEVREKTPSAQSVVLTRMMGQLFRLCEIHDIDLGAAIAVKYEYNRTRPYRHGGKKA